MSKTPSLRIRSVNDRTQRGDADYVLYWMTAFRRLNHNFALQRAIELANERELPLVIFEALRTKYRWASDRLHTFVLQGMRANAQQASGTQICYASYVEPRHGDGRGLLETLAGRAAVVVSDDYPCFFLPAMYESVGRRLDVPLELVDSNGLLPLAAADRVFPTAYAFRRFLQKELPAHLAERPQPHPLRKLRTAAPANLLPDLSLWPSALGPDDAIPDVVASLPIDHAVSAVSETGGHPAAADCLKSFLRERLPRYADDRNNPDSDAASHLSPWLHFGHISPHEVFQAVIDAEDWDIGQLGSAADSRGSRSGWWNLSPAAEAFLDELITWRELGYNMCSKTDDYDRYESLPDWALKTLDEHAADPRPETYEPDELIAAATGDDIWNAAQRQLVRDGRIHNYLRMLWGKKIFEWSESPQQALETMIELNNRFALDGRDPNSWSGIFWVLGRYDRAWGPERPIYGKIRYMTSDSTRRKLKLNDFLRRYGPDRDDERD